MIRAVLTDIEGTTSSLSFVKDVLFPYARARIGDFVRTQREDPQVARLLDDARAEAGDPRMDLESVIAVFTRWIDEDRKVTPLKALQGLIWEAGYRNGAFHGHIYPDTAPALRRWKASGLDLYVYSSGSVHAQKLLFGHTAEGDLTPLFSRYFDTRIGAKGEADSYRRIAAEIGLPAEAVLFLSDVTAELDAARAAGMQTLRLVRDGTPDPGAVHPEARDFDAIRPRIG